MMNKTPTPSDKTVPVIQINGLHKSYGQLDVHLGAIIGMDPRSRINLVGLQVGCRGLSQGACHLRLC